jgi:hypothetical protein
MAAAGEKVVASLPVERYGEDVCASSLKACLSMKTNSKLSTANVFWPNCGEATHQTTLPEGGAARRAPAIKWVRLTRAECGEGMYTPTYGVGWLCRIEPDKSGGKRGRMRIEGERNQRQARIREAAWTQPRCPRGSGRSIGRQSGA